jgi:hypothetical protein
MSLPRRPNEVSNDIYIPKNDSEEHFPRFFFAVLLLFCNFAALMEKALLVKGYHLAR